MQNVSVEIEGLTDEEAIENLFDASDSGFVLQNRGVGRSQRYSHFGDVVKIVGEIGTLASFAKTMWEVLKLRTSAGQRETIIRIAAPDGRKITIKASDSHSAAEILRAMRHLE